MILGDWKSKFIHLYRDCGPPLAVFEVLLMRDLEGVQKPFKLHSSVTSTDVNA